MSVRTPLITAAALAGSGAVVFDCRHDLARPGYGREAYAAGHIPGAFRLDLDTDLSAQKTGRNGRHPLPDSEDFAALIRKYGVGPDTFVVAYDDAGGMYAARLWWMLRWIDHQQVAVLDGGIAAWQAAGLPLETTEPALPGAGTLAAGSGAATVDADTLLAGLGKPGLQVIDARAPDRFRGENETLDPVGGHIPGARNRFFRDNLGADGRFKPAAQLAEEWRAVLGTLGPGEIVCQCGSGVTACHNLLALEVAGLPGARLYPGSWSEWCSDPERPVARGD